MLAKPQRIAAKSAIDAFFGQDFRKARGLSASTKAMVLKVLPPKTSRARFGFIVNTKVDNRASVRNRVKRQLREIMRALASTLVQPVDILIVLLPPSKKATYEQLQADVVMMLQRLRLVGRKN